MKEELFWAHVERRSNGCWIWMGAKRAGYGGFGQELAHVWAYKHFIGPIPEGFQVDHTCHNGDPHCPGGKLCYHQPCVNFEEHLEAVAPLVNQLRGHGNQYKSIAYCKHRHEFTEENTYRFGPDKKWRGCKTCRYARRQGKDPATYVRSTPSR